MCETGLNMTTGIPQQCLSCHFDVLDNITQVLALFLGTFIADFEYILFIMNVVNATLWCIFAEHQIAFQNISLQLYQ